MKCHFCGEELIWGGDFDASDYGYEENGVVTNLTCSNCGAFWEGHSIEGHNNSIKTTTDLKQIILKCRDIETPRTTSGVYFKLSEEVGELATELNVKYHGAYKGEGEDGIIGECVDAIICLCDILNKENVDLDEIGFLINKKIKKWKENVEK